VLAAAQPRWNGKHGQNKIEHCPVFNGRFYSQRLCEWIVSHGQAQMMDTLSVTDVIAKFSKSGATPHQYEFYFEYQHFMCHCKKQRELLYIKSEVAAYHMGTLFHRDFSADVFRQVL
jgi:hypothetical protein